MYMPAHFEESRVDVLHALIRAHPLGTLVTMTANGLEANHLPFQIHPEPAPFGTLRGHVARANRLWRDSLPGVDALVVFSGPDAYVSPGWYPSKRESGKVVPTWNYAVVHAHGPLRIIDDREWLRAFVSGLTHRFESPRDDPWKVTDAPSDYIDQMLGAIVGIEIPVMRALGKWKVSQNRAQRDREGVAAGLLQEGGEDAMPMSELVGGTLPPP